MSMTDVRDAYAARAAEYTNLMGAIDDMSPVDRARIEAWADGIGGTILDAGCGPGHWTAHLHARRGRTEGLDLVSAFVDGARRRFPDVVFTLGSTRALPYADGSLGGILAWYSLIHEQPAEVPRVLGEFRRALAPGGGLLLGFFDGPARESFPHKVHTAYFWSIDAMAALLRDAGFTVVDSDARTDAGHRPHASIAAVATAV
jgi:SAM-dependent methyltransferase